MGDVVSICSDPARCLSEIHRLLKPGGIAIFTVDNAVAAIDHFIESGNLAAMAAFVHTGKTEWLTKNVEERFSVRMFTPSEIESLVRARGLKSSPGSARRRSRHAATRSSLMMTARLRRWSNLKPCCRRNLQFARPGQSCAACRA